MMRSRGARNGVRASIISAAFPCWTELASRPAFCSTMWRKYVTLPRSGVSAPVAISIRSSSAKTALLLNRAPGSNTILLISASRSSGVPCAITTWLPIIKQIATNHWRRHKPAVQFRTRTPASHPVFASPTARPPVGCAGSPGIAHHALAGVAAHHVGELALSFFIQNLLTDWRQPNCGHRACLGLRGSI